MQISTGSCSNTKSNRTPFQISKGSSSNTKLNGNLSLPMLNQMEPQIQISKGSSSNTKSNGNSSLQLLKQMEAKLNWISRDYYRHPSCWGGRAHPLLLPGGHCSEQRPFKGHYSEHSPDRWTGSGGPVGRPGQVRTGLDRSGRAWTRKKRCCFQKKVFWFGLVRDGGLNTPFGRLNTPFRTVRWTPNTKNVFWIEHVFLYVFLVRTRPPARTRSTYPNYVRSNVL